LASSGQNVRKGAELNPKSQVLVVSQNNTPYRLPKKCPTFASQKQKKGNYE
jgi:hypothetical protein